MYEQKVRDTSSISMFLFRAAVIVVFVVLVVRLYQLQVLDGASFRQQADDNRFDLIEVPAPRGVIYDRNGTILTRNRPSFEFGVVKLFV
jgi:penicillin-binding protein 2